MDSTHPILYSWHVHPARERWQIALATGLVIALASWLTMELMQQAAWGVFAAIVLVVGCNRFFFPTRYQVTEDGITAHFPMKSVRYQWTELRRFVFDQTGGFLSPRAKRSFLDEYRGISLLFPDDSSKVIQEIRGRLPREAIVREVSRKSALPQEGHSCGG